MRDSNPHKRGAAEVNNAEMDRRVKAIAERSRREGHTGEVTRRFVDPKTLPPSKMNTFKERVCAAPACSERFVPTGPRQKYHTKECANAVKQAAKTEARRARAQAQPRSDRVAAALSSAGRSASEREAQDKLARDQAAAEAQLAKDQAAAEARHEPETSDHSPEIAAGDERARYLELLYSVAEAQRDRGNAPPRHILDRLERLLDAAD